jgi:hypothetical protein
MMNAPKAKQSNAEKNNNSTPEQNEIREKILVIIEGISKFPAFDLETK